jgi:hypothetical protein
MPDPGFRTRVGYLSDGGRALVATMLWWGEKDGKKCMHRYSWWKMCQPKKQAGMGFRDLHCFNLAMLANKYGDCIFSQNHYVRKY